MRKVNFLRVDLEAYLSIDAFEALIVVSCCSVTSLEKNGS